MDESFASQPLPPQEEHSPKTRDWRVFVLLGIASFILVITIVVGIRRMLPSKPRLDFSTIRTHISPQVTAIPTTMQQAPSIGTLKEYSGHYISFSYPETWQVHVDTFTADRELTVTGSRLTEKTGVPTLSVNAVVSTSSAAFDLSGSLLTNSNGAGLAKKAMVVNGQSITLFSGIVPITVIQGRTQEVSHREIIANFKRENWIYQLVFSYPGEKIDSDYEALFMHIIGSMSFQVQ